MTPGGITIHSAISISRGKGGASDTAIYLSELGNRIVDLFSPEKPLFLSLLSARSPRHVKISLSLLPEKAQMRLCNVDAYRYVESKHHMFYDNIARSHNGPAVWTDGNETSTLPVDMFLYLLLCFMRHPTVELDVGAVTWINPSRSDVRGKSGAERKD